MYGRTYKLYPFSEKNRKALEDAANKLFDIAGDDVDCDEFDKACEISAILHEMDITSNGKVAWLKGKDIATAKKYIAA